MSIWFYPDDWESYKTYLVDTRGIALKDNVWEHTSGNTRAWVATDHLKKHYIAWEDVVLAESMRRWIEKHS